MKQAISGGRLYLYAKDFIFHHECSADESKVTIGVVAEGVVGKMAMQSSKYIMSRSAERSSPRLEVPSYLHS